METTTRPRWLASTRPLVLVLVFFALLTVGLGRFALGSLFSDLCASTEIRRLTSPDGRHDAVLLRRHHGLRGTWLRVPGGRGTRP